MQDTWFKLIVQDTKKLEKNRFQNEKQIWKCWKWSQGQRWVTCLFWLLLLLKVSTGTYLLYVSYISHVQPAQVAYRSGIHSLINRYPPCESGPFILPYIYHIRPNGVTLVLPVLVRTIGMLVVYYLTRPKPPPYFTPIQNPTVQYAKKPLLCCH